MKLLLIGRLCRGNLIIEKFIPGIHHLDCMKIIRIGNEKDVFFQSFWEIYEPASPFCERRSLDDHIRIFTNKTYFLEAWIENEAVLGFIGWWNCGDLRFVEHYL
jgi:hypothetical protein